MAGKKPIVVNGREFAVLRLIWEHGPLTVREIREHLQRQEEIPYTSVLSLMQLMEEKGYVGHTNEGKTYRYFARCRQGAMTKRLLRDFMNRFFEGSAEAFLTGLTQSGAIDPQLWQQLQNELNQQDESDD